MSEYCSINSHKPVFLKSAAMGLLKTFRPSRFCKYRTIVVSSKTIWYSVASDSTLYSIPSSCSTSMHHGSIHKFSFVACRLSNTIPTVGFIVGFVLIPSNLAIRLIAQKISEYQKHLMQRLAPAQTAPCPAPTPRPARPDTPAGFPWPCCRSAHLPPLGSRRCRR